jgi:hypothetical protein
LSCVRLISGLVLAALLVCAGEPSARDLAKRARKAEKQKDFANAYLLYSQAAAKDPAKREYWQRAQALRRRAATASNVMPASLAAAPDRRPAEIGPEPEPVQPANQTDIIEARRPQPPVELKSSAPRRDIDLKGDSRTLWEQVARAYGLDVIFDGDYEAGEVQTFRTTGADYREALHALMTATSSFIVPMSETLMLVVKDTEAKRREVENSVALSVPIPEPFALQEAQELGRTVQQIMEIQRFSIDSAQRMAIFRDRVSKARPAQLIFAQLLTARAQVMIEVELMSVGKSTSNALGLNLPTSFPITALQKTMTLGGSWPGLAVTIGSAMLVARGDRSDVRTLYKASLRALDSQAAQLHVGEKYPIMSVAYIGDTGGSQDVFVPPPTFNFEDLGLILKLTPKVHDRNEVTFDVEAEFKLLGAGSLNGIPVISNRRFATQVRLGFDETAIVSGLVTQNDIRTLSGPAGLLNIPVLGGLLGQTSWTKDDVQLLLTIRPKLLTLPPTEVVTRPIWTGTESRTRIPM